MAEKKINGTMILQVSMSTPDEVWRKREEELKKEYNDVKVVFF